MTHRRSKPRQFWCFPAINLIKQFPDNTHAGTIAQQLGANRSTIQNWRTQNTKLTPYQADTYAIRLGKHPSQIWHNWFDLPEYGNTPPKHTD